MTKRTFTIARDEMGRPTIIKGRKVKVDVGYDPITGKFNELVFSGRRELIPNVADLISLIQDVDVYVKTEDRTNILLDLLTQTAYTERRATITNDNGVPTPSAPPSNLTATTYKGKFFPRGCRGYLRGFRVYCKRTGAGTLTLAFSPQQGMGEIGTVVITPTSSWDWTGGFLTQFWNYDSMFVWVKACSADVSFGYDEVLPSDGWSSSDSGVTWTNEVRRYFIRALGYGLTVGDVPVSGTVNNIPIPNASSVVAPGTFEVPTSTVTEVVNAEGVGKLLFLYVRFHFEEVAPTTLIEITVDGGTPHIFDYWANLYQEPPVKVAQAGDTATWFLITLPYEFKRSFRVRVYHEEGNTKNVTVRVVLNLIS